MTDVKSIAGRFDFGGKITDIAECRAGHINGTYFVTADGKKFVLQMINKSVFHKPEEVMANIIGVTGHIRKKLEDAGGDSENGTLCFVKSGDNYFFIDADGEYWRAYRFVDGNCYQSCDSSDLLCRVGRAFGVFQRQLSDYDAASLYETIPDFHNTVKRYEAFEAALKADVAGRAGECKAEIEFVRSRKATCGFIVNKIADGSLPLRVTHNDTKLNNIIMDKKTGEGLCVIDLDTVMPGSMLYDFGDAIRFGASSAAEDETDLDKVFVKTELFEAFAKGFIEGLDGSATIAEIKAFPMSAIILTLETGIRFLTDFLSGDTYFRIEYGKHNLDRAKNQFKLVCDMETKKSELDAIIEKLLRR